MFKLETHLYRLTDITQCSSTDIVYIVEDQNRLVVPYKTLETLYVQLIVLFPIDSDN